MFGVLKWRVRVVVVLGRWRRSVCESMCHSAPADTTDINKYVRRSSRLIVETVGLHEYDFSCGSQICCGYLVKP